MDSFDSDPPLNNDSNAHDASAVQRTNKLTVICLNCISIRSQEKRATLEGLIFEHAPDVIIGCESHLDYTIVSSEVFSQGYTIIRKDRMLGADGVFLCF